MTSSSSLYLRRGLEAGNERLIVSLAVPSY